MSPSTRIAGWLLAAAIGAASAQAQQAKPESMAAGGSLQRAVELTLAALKPHQRSIVRGTAKDSLSLLLPEWGSDIQDLLGLNPANTRLAAELCGKACSVEEATLLVMEAAHEVLLRSN